MMRTTFLPFALPDIGNAEIAAVTSVLESGWITTGPKTREFESAFAAAVGAKYAVAVNSCTAAMHLALEALGVRPDDEVITSPYTFASTAEVIRYFGAKPVFVDVEPGFRTIQPTLLEQAITNRTKAIMPVHIAGLPAELDMIQRIAQHYNIPVIEDAAHAFPTTYQGRPIGSLSDITCFSFYATKTITTGEGGMICTDNEAWAERCRMMALHGISKDAWKRYTAQGSWYYEIFAPGYKYNMTDITAALGLVQLGKSDAMWRRRGEIAQYYHEAFSSQPALEVPPVRDNCQHAWHLYMLSLNLERLHIDRTTFVEELKLRNIGTSVHFIPLHIHPYYQETYGYQPHDFPVAYQEYMREVSLPIYSKMSDDDVHNVITAVLDIVLRYQC